MRLENIIHDTRLRDMFWRDDFWLKVHEYERMIVGVER